jgi:hypothetical protein
MRSVIMSLIVMGAMVRSTFGWGNEGHEAIGLLAQQMISEATRARVQELLNQGGDRDLASVSIWADEGVAAAHQAGPLTHDPEALAFNQRFPGNSSWHFVNLPLGTRDYEAAKAFTSRHDVVQTICQCITVLESPKPIEGEFNRVEALRLLVHMVGDIHQPLHCGCGYYRLDDPRHPQLIKDPAQAAGLPSDRGGNGLFYGPNEELHLFWDVGLVEGITGSKDYRLLAAYLAKRAEPLPVTPGDYHHWAASWAVESVEAADKAYDGIRFEDAQLNGDRTFVRISIELPAGYAEANTAIAASRLTKGAARLAQLLDRINWP